MDKLLIEISGWLGYLGRPLVLLQGLMIAALMLGYRWGIQPRLAARAPVVRLLGTLGLLLALRLGAQLLQVLGQPSGLVEYTVRIYAIWQVLIAGRVLLTQRFGATPIDRLYGRIIKPIFLLFLAGSLVNQFDSLEDFADIPLFPLFNEPLTTGGIVLLFSIPYFLVVLSEFPVTWLGSLLQRLLGFSRGTREAIQIACRYLLVGGGFLWVLHRIGLNANAIAAVAGGLSVGLGFGVKEVFSNFISGLWLLFEGSVGPGEILFIDGDPCEVRSLGMRAAVLWRDRDNAELVVPNQDFFTKTTTTYTGSDRMRRSQVDVSAAYQHDPELVIRLLEQVALASPRVLPQPAPKALLLSYGDSGINYALRYWIANPMDNAGIKSEVSTAVWHAFASEGIEIPFPQRVVHPG
ncbi:MULTISPECIES: mechanosensitive ion channel family protein [unclassified Synechococcus]|uniref:mechanosensitive ion channel family protein n=1 Tax=unclassified Synechococcus TaxID=2626047 RepID=UPI0021A5CF09|nr:MULTISPECIES: mechanosensitive ion channel domain-containing protein [unclassified Synechococcus]MCT0212214.1 mechanosensitive ion channel [Synechococcus sp. CS-1326]MCT0234373.1 mechanosensitive ion channel [Synechococcus sp. CS-1327]